MGKSFDIRREVALEATPEQVFAAVTEGAAGWMFPTGFQPTDDPEQLAAQGFVEFDPPNKVAHRMEGPDGWFNALEYVIETRDGGGVTLRYVHSGVFTDDWDTQYDGAGKHTEFYLHTLNQYVKYFPGRETTYVAGSGPESAGAPEAFAMFCVQLGVMQGGPGAPVTLDVPGVGQVDAVVDFRNANFLGLRSADSLIRIFGRNAFGDRVGYSVHQFAEGVDQAKSQEAWQAWFDGHFAGGTA
ncbi:SRPBCC domain-containing protein [Pseudonocardiaceae bacterium YIM PH 21723]|nr:SRPBCC domain-containing protein [Pseudonocardiaceae bacterium YIM PH 21723]